MISRVSSCAERSAASVLCTSKLPESRAAPPSALIVKLGSTSVRWPEVSTEPGNEMEISSGASES